MPVKVNRAEPPDHNLQSTVRLPLMIPSQDSCSDPGSTKRHRSYDPNDSPGIGPPSKISKTSLGHYIGDAHENEGVSRLEERLKETLQVQNGTLDIPLDVTPSIFLCALSNSTLFSQRQANERFATQF